MFGVSKVEGSFVGELLCQHVVVAYESLTAAMGRIRPSSVGGWVTVAAGRRGVTACRAHACRRSLTGTMNLLCKVRAIDFDSISRESPGILPLLLPL